MQYRDTRVDALQTQVLHLSYQVNYLTALIFAQPTLIVPHNIPSPPVFSQRQQNAQPQQYHPPPPQQYNPPPTNAPQHFAPQMSMNQRNSSSTFAQSQQPHQSQHMKAAPQQYNPAPSYAPHQHSAPQMKVYHQETFSNPPAQMRNHQNPAQSQQHYQSHYMEAPPSPLNISPSRNETRSENNFRQLPNQPETPHRKLMQKPPRNVNRAQQRKKPDLREQQNQKKPDLREQRNQNMKQLPNQPETPHFQSKPFPPPISHVQEKKESNLRDQCNQNMRQLPNQPETPYFQSQPFPPPFPHVQEKEKSRTPSQPMVLKEETSENDPINQFECWPPKEFLEDEEISDENVIEPAVERPADVIRMDQNMGMTEEDEETLQMMEKISMMNSSDFIRNDTVMDPEIAKFFLMGEIRRNRMKKKEEEKRSANIYSIKGKAKMMEEENNKMQELYGEHKAVLQSRKFANDSVFRKLQEQNKLQVWPSVPLQI